MKYIKDEKGSSLFYLLWIMTATIVIFLIVTNIARIYVVKQQASTAAQLAAFAATRELLIATNEAIIEFDIEMIKSLEPEEVELYEPLKEEVEKQVNTFTENGMPREKAYIKALNYKLPSRLNSDDLLISIFKSRFVNIELSNQVHSTVRKIIKENEGNEEHVEIKISKDKYRVEVKTDATYETITDGSLISSLTKDIPQIGSGPPLIYLKYVLN